MKQRLNILSIDFDFFQNVTKDVMTSYYPDGHDLSTELSIFIWSSHYADNTVNEILNEITINTKLLNEIKSIINKNAKHKPTSMICNSHRHIYDLILKQYDKTKYQGINLVNIDMHHDMFNDNPELDCGNWVNHITKAIPDFKLTWIANPISLSAYGLDSDEFCMIQHDFENIKDIKFDIIFLCRSDIWLPPHLDIYFDELVQCFTKRYQNILAEPNVLKPRDMMPHVQQLKQTYENMRKQYENKLE